MKSLAVGWVEEADKEKAKEEEEEEGVESEINKFSGSAAEGRVLASSSSSASR